MRVSPKLEWKEEPKRPKYEYSLMDVSGNYTLPDITQELNMNGKSGWKLTSIIEWADKKKYYVLMREIIP